MSNGAHYGSIIPIANVVRPLPQGGTIFHFDHFLVGTSHGRLVYPLDGHVATLRPGEGKFGGAVAVEEGTTNLLKDVANFATGSWSRGNIDVTSLEYNGMPGARFTPTGAGLAVVSQVFLSSGAAGRTFTWSFYARGQTARTFHVNFYGGVSGTFQPYVIQLTTEWRRYSITHTFPATATSGRIQWGNAYPNWGTAYLDWIEVAGVQVEEKPFTTSFVDGTRAGGRLSYPKSLIAGLNALTVAAWTSGPPYWVSGTRYLVAAQTSGTSPHGDLFALQQSGTHNRIRLWVRNDANSSATEAVYDNVWDGNWHLIVGVINKSPEPGRRPIELYVDGELVASRSNVNAVPDLSTIDETWGVQVGNWRGSLYWSGLIDELLILPYAASEEEVMSWYSSGAPFWDGGTPLGVAF